MNVDGLSACMYTWRLEHDRVSCSIGGHLPFLREGLSLVLELDISAKMGSEPLGVTCSGSLAPLGYRYMLPAFMQVLGI